MISQFIFSIKMEVSIVYSINQKQLEILSYIKEEIKKKGYPPSVREICIAVDLKSTSTVHSHLNRLEECGYIRKDPTKPRAIEIVSSDDEDGFYRRNTIDIPLLGEVTAGDPILAVEHIEEFLPIPSSWVSNGTYFMLKIKGDSMVDAGIFDRDIVIVEKTNYAKNGDIVVALIDDEVATVKRFYKEKDRIRLQPENDAYSPIYSRNVSIVGIVKTLIRTNVV